MKALYLTFIKKNARLILLIGFLIAGIIALKIVYANPTTLYIDNESQINCDVVYVTDREGQWKDSKASLPALAFIQSKLSHANFYHAAVFQLQIVVGGKLGQEYCSATMTMPAFGKKVEILNHQGNCHFIKTADRELEVIIDPKENSRSVQPTAGGKLI